MHKLSRGMTLLEILVAFVILALAMSVILRIFSGGMRSATVSESYSSAIYLAQSRLATVGVERPLAPGEDSGQVGATMKWRISIAPVDDGGEADRLLMPVRQYLVRTNVSWQEDGHDKQIELSSLRIGPRQ